MLALLSFAMRRRRSVLGIFLLVAALAAILTPPYFRGAAFVVRAAGMEGAARRVADWDTSPVREMDWSLAWRDGALRSRRYFPQSGSGRPVLLVPGVHAGDEDNLSLIHISEP